MIDLGRSHIEKLMENRFQIFPICIPSYKRWDRGANTTISKIIENCDAEIQANTYVFVRAEQAEAYRAAFKTVNIVVLPIVNGLAGTRQFIVDYVADTLKKPYFVDMDDDITDLKFVWHDQTGDHLSKKEETDYSKVLRLGCAISRMAFEKHDCVMGNFHRVRFASNYPASQTAYVVNKGSTPRQVMFISAKALRMKGIRRNLAFDETGDDVGFVAEICKKRGNLFQIPCLAYAFTDDAVNSVIRNDSNRRRLAKQEHDLLKQYPMGKYYLKITQTFEDGSYRFSDIDYKRYCEVTGAKKETVGIMDFIGYMREKANGGKKS